MALLINLLTEKEKVSINKNIEIDICKDIRKLTMVEFSELASILINTENSGKIKYDILSCEAIRILTERAIEKGIDIY